jgi:hypothetical protein
MKIKLTLLISLILHIVKAQQNPTINNPGGVVPSGQSNGQYWSRAGNLLTNGNNNIFGTRWNSGIFTMTNGQYRMQLNGSVNYPVNGFTGVRDGYLLLGQQMLNNYGAGNGAFSQLHLNGINSTINQMPSLGYRPWMQTGVTFTDNADLAYLGLRRVDNPTNSIDLTEVTMCWSNDGAGSNGPDDMVFRFLNGGGGTITNDLLNENDLDGRHVARFTDRGLMGLGNTFGVNGINNLVGRYVRPQSLLHMSYSNSQSIWSQYTNRDGTNATGGINGTGERDIDGLRIGILGSNNALINGTAAIYNQEKRPLLLSTDARTNTITPNSGVTNERVRVTSVSTPTNLPISGMGVYNPSVFTPNTSDTNKTRVSISHDPTRPVTRPLSLLHLGYNTGLNALNPASTDGWRSWMDIGTFTNNGTDHIFVGLKREGTDRSDAIVNWGDNQNGGSTGNLGPDNLRFIFTSTLTGLPFGDSLSMSPNGLEIARMVPDTASTLPTNFGMMGIGDFSPTSPNNGIDPLTNSINYVDAKLDIDGDLRIRTVLQKDTLLRVLVIDTTDHNRVYYRDIALGTGGKGFYSCADTTGGDTLISDSRINLNNFNLYFEKNDSLGVNHVGVGYNCGDSLRAKLSVQQIHPFTVNQSTIAISGVNRDTSNVLGTSYIGVEGRAIGLQNLGKVTNIGGSFVANNAVINHGITSKVTAVSIPGDGEAIGGNFAVNTNARSNMAVNAESIGVGSGNTINIGVNGRASSSPNQNRGGRFIADASTNNIGTSNGVEGIARGSSVSNIGGFFSAAGNQAGSINIGVIGSTSNNSLGFPITVPGNSRIGVYGFSAPTNSNGSVGYAGYFDGNVFINGPANGGTGFPSVPSDQQFKTDVQNIDNATELLLQLTPKTFYYDTLNSYDIRFSSAKQYGLIAQEVEQIIPDLVSVQFKPEMVDSVGNIIIPSVSYKALNYEGLISVLIKGHQEQKQQIDSLQNVINNRDSLINNLNDRLTHLESCLSGILPFLCQISHNSIQPTQQEFQQQLKKEIDVQLSNKGTIILNQNVPNPFAEQTQISFSIPETVKKAQIHFYDANGKLINSVEVQERGLGQLNVFANDLSTGMYTYTLVADGQIVATKKMMKQ